MRRWILGAAVAVTVAAAIPARAGEAVCEGTSPDVLTCTRTFEVVQDGPVGIRTHLSGTVFQGFQGVVHAEVSSPSTSQHWTCYGLGPGPGEVGCKGTMSTGFRAGETATLTVTAAAVGGWRVTASS